MLKICGLKKYFGNYRALDGLDMELAEGMVYGFVGPNGAGKTTTIRIIAGLLKPDAGTVEIGGVHAGRFPRRVLEKIGYVPDHFGVYDNLKVSEYMEFFASCYGMEGLVARKRAETLLEQVGLGDKLEMFVDGLSRGMKQRLCLARALIHDPPLLVMDEPTAGLDPRTRVEFGNMVRELGEQGKAILISSHLLTDLSELCTDIGIIDAGKLVLQGSREELKNRIRASRPVVISVRGSLDTALQILKEHPLVQTITIRDCDIMAGFSGDEKQENELLRCLIEADVAVVGFFREPGSLESVFMEITNHEERRVILSYEDESGL